MGNTAEIQAMTQIQYEKLLSTLAAAIRTQRKLINITDVKRCNGFTEYTVKRQGAYNSYKVAVTVDNKARVLGLII